MIKNISFCKVLLIGLCSLCALFPSVTNALSPGDTVGICLGIKAPIPRGKDWVMIDDLDAIPGNPFDLTTVTNISTFETTALYNADGTDLPCLSYNPAARENELDFAWDAANKRIIGSHGELSTPPGVCTTGNGRTQNCFLDPAEDPLPREVFIIYFEVDIKDSHPGGEVCNGGNIGNATWEILPWSPGNFYKQCWPVIVNTPTPTVTDTPVPTATDTPTATHTFTPTHTHTATDTVTNTMTPTLTQTDTPTSTMTFTQTATDTPTNTSTTTNTTTSTETKTHTATSTATKTSTSTVTDTVTQTHTATDTETATTTMTETSTSTITDTATVTNTATSTPTQTDTSTVTSTPTPVFYNAEWSNLFDQSSGAPTDYLLPPCLAYSSFRRLYAHDR